MIIALLLILLALLGLIPLVVAAPLAIVSMVVGGAGGWLLNRRLQAIPRENGGEAMIGRIVSAVTDIDADGTIRFGNELWNARSLGPPIKKGRQARIERLRGLTVLVSPVG